MAAHHNFEAMASKLDDPNSGMSRNRRRARILKEFTDLRTDLGAKLTQAIDIRDNIESYCQGPQYAAFLSHFVPVFLKLLDGPPVFFSGSIEHVSVPL